MKLLAVRFAALGLYLPVCAITSIIRFQVRACPISERARVIVSLPLSVSSVDDPVKGIELAARLASRTISARFNAGWAVVALTIACAAAVASDGATVGNGLGVGLTSTSFFSALCKTAATTGTFFVLMLAIPTRG